MGEFVPRGCVRPAVMDARLRVSEGEITIPSLNSRCGALFDPTELLSTSLSRPSSFKNIQGLSLFTSFRGSLPRFSQFSANQVSLDDRFPISLLILVA